VRARREVCNWRRGNAVEEGRGSRTFILQCQLKRNYIKRA
jgi:hypothetical protein